MSYLLAMDAKVTKCFCLIIWLFFGQPDFLPKFLQNSDFRPCATYFTTQEEKLKPKYKRVWKLFRKIYFHVFFFFEMPAFGVKLMSVSIYGSFIIVFFSHIWLPKFWYCNVCIEIVISVQVSKKIFGIIKGALSGLIQVLATESPLKMIKCFSFHLKSSFRSQDV